MPTKAASNLMLGMVASCPVAWKKRVVTTDQYTAVGHVEGATPVSVEGGQQRKAGSGCTHAHMHTHTQL